jgi:hypothetical protein
MTAPTISGGVHHRLGNGACPGQPVKSQWSWSFTMCAWVRSTLAGLDGFFEVRCGTRNLGYAIPKGPASAQALALETEHKCGVTDTLDCFWRPTAIDGGTKSLCERLVHARLPAPLPTHRGPR